jgi:hypothetical protein
MPSVLEELIRKVNSKVAVILAPKRGEITRGYHTYKDLSSRWRKKRKRLKPYCRGKFYVMKIYVQS